MDEAKRVANRIRVLKTRNTKRDANYMKLMAIRDGDYEKVAPGLFSEDFDQPLVANLIDTTARDIAEVMAPLPTVSCPAMALDKESKVREADKRSAIANHYLQASRLQDQMFGGADRYGSFGFMALIVEPDFKRKTPTIRIDDNPTAHYTLDHLGRTKEYVSLGMLPLDVLCLQYPEHEAKLRAKHGSWTADNRVEVAHYFNETHEKLIVLDPEIVLHSIEHKIGECPIRVIERPKLTGQSREKGQFDDVIWVQVARALVQQYTMNALERSVNAPIAVPNDVNAIEIGPDTVIQTENPQGVGRINLQLTPGLFPEQQILTQEQRLGSRYPEGRSGNIDASIITGQGVQALMGTFDTQIQTFQRLFASALKDVEAFCFKMDEAYWGSEKKTVEVEDNGSTRELTYTPAKDIGGKYTVNVTYGVIAGLDPNRGLVFILQALAGGLISKSTARRYMPVDLNPLAEERQITLEALQEATAGTISIFPQLLLQMQQQGMDPRESVVQLAELKKRLEKGDDPVEALEAVFAPKEKPGQEEAPVEDPITQAMQAAMGGGGEGGGMPGEQSAASDMLMMLAGTSPSGNPQMGASVSRMIPT